MQTCVAAFRNLRALALHDSKLPPGSLAALPLLANSLQTFTVASLLSPADWHAVQQLKGLKSLSATNWDGRDGESRRAMVSC